MAKLQGVFRPAYTEAGRDGARVRRTSKTWAYRFEYRGIKYQQGGFATADLARTARDTRRAEVRDGLESDWRKVTLAAVHRLASARRVEWDASTAASFDQVWKRLHRFFAPQEFAASIDDTRLLEYVAFRRREGGAQNTIRLDLQHLRTALLLAHRKRLLPWVPAFPRMKYQRREQTVASVELSQIVALMPEHYRLFFAAAEEMGWRARSELRTRRWAEHVDFGPERWTCCGVQLDADACSCGAGRPGWVRLDAASSKTDAARVFPMTRRLRAILVAARERCDRVRLATSRFSPWVFVRDDGRPLGEYRSAWQAALQRLGVGKIPGRRGPWSAAKVVHDVRRTAIRRLRSEGVDRDTRKAMVGHTSDATHALYEERQDLDAMREAARLLDQRRLDGVEQGVDQRVVQLSLFRGRR